jgi:DNA-binding NtrC family response regulator
MERALLLCAGGEITVEHLPLKQMKSEPGAAPAVSPPADDTGALKLTEGASEPAVESPASEPAPEAPAASLDEATDERSRIIAALMQCAGNQTHAARLLGISRGTLVTRIAEYAIPRPRKR